MPSENILRLVRRVCGAHVDDADDAMCSNGDLGRALESVYNY